MTAKKAAKKAVKKTAPKVAVKKTAAKKTAIKKVAAKKVAVKEVPAKKAVEKAVKKAVKKVAAKKTAAKSKSAGLSKTTVSAKVNVGYGNTLFLRGDAPGLSWSQGVPMDCAADDVWSMSISGVKESFEFKVLINDSYWNAGYNHTAKPGVNTKIEPIF